MKFLKYPALFLPILLLFSSCSMKKYCPDPDARLPEHVLRDRTELDSLAMADMEWWEIYTDSTLQKLIRKTLANNKDMRIAISKIKQLRYQSRTALAENLPSVGFRIGHNNEITSYYTEGRSPDPEFEFKGKIAWEYNLFGAQAWNSRKAKDQYLASIEGQRALQMSLISEVAKAYFELLTLDKQLEIVQRTIETRRESMQKTQLRFKGGLTSETTYRQAIVEFASAATLVPDLEKQIALKENEISILAGEFPSRIERQRIDMQSGFLIDIPMGLPSELLLRRPDVRQARAELDAAMSNAGFYFANRFPSIQLSWEGGLENSSIRHLFQSPYQYLIANLVGPVFAFGKNHSKYKASLENYMQEKAAYEQKILEVFKEVNDAMVVYTKVTETSSLLLNLQEAARKYVELAELQYLNGVISYMDVLDAQRRYFSAQQSLTQSVCDEYLALVDLYKALGGGWNEELPEDALTRIQVQKQEKAVRKQMSDSTVENRPGLSKEETLRTIYREYLGKQVTEKNEQLMQEDFQHKEDTDKKGVTKSNR